ncbi:MAG: abortive infection protein [Chloroflexi bacterium OLB14]|nr:MAG: abortive infection protein [Chloroflexi bacterium OLB14]
MHWFNNSKLFDLAKQGQRLPHIALVIPLAFIFSILSQFGIVPVVIIMGVFYGFTGSGISTPNNLSALTAGFWMAAQLISGFILTYIILWAWLRFIEKRPFWTLGYEIKNAVKQYARGFIFGMLMFVGAVTILGAFRSVSFESGDPNQQGVAAIGGVILVLIGWMIQGGAEEVLIRGWVLPVIGARYKAWLGLLISSLIFAILHGLNPNLSGIALINLALFGIFAGLYAMREGSMWGISALHSVWNWVQGNFFGFEVSGLQAQGGTLINLMETGDDWLTGGAFGPEGGVAVTVVLIIGILIVLFWKEKHQENITQ